MKTIKLTLVLYSFHLCIPLVGLMMYLIGLILNLETNSYITFISKFYYSGLVGHIEAWRIHIFLIFICFIIAVFAEND